MGRVHGEAECPSWCRGVDGAEFKTASIQFKCLRFAAQVREQWSLEKGSGERCTREAWCLGVEPEVEGAMLPIQTPDNLMDLWGKGVMENFYKVRVLVNP